MEHLLFAEGSDKLTTNGGVARCRYLMALTSVAHEEIEGILQDWEGAGESPGFAGFFDGSAASSLHPRVAEAEVVRSLVFLVRTIANMQLGAALGVDTAPDMMAIPFGADRVTLATIWVTNCWAFPKCIAGPGATHKPSGIGHMVAQLSPRNRQPYDPSQSTAP